MTKRKPLTTEQYFEQYILLAEKTIAEIQEEIKNPPSGTYKMNMAYLDNYNYLIKLFTATYSAGYSIDQLTLLCQQCIQALVVYKQQPKAKSIFFTKEVDEYMNALTLLTWGITLPIDQFLFNQLVTCIDSENQRDALLDLLIATRRPDRSHSQSLSFPKIYTPLYRAVTLNAPTQIVRFLEHWYKTCLSKTATHDLHTMHGGDDSGFTGYWAWEVAGLTYALNMDDRTYRDMPYYPADLVDYAWNPRSDRPIGSV